MRTILQIYCHRYELLMIMKKVKSLKKISKICLILGKVMLLNIVKVILMNYLEDYQLIGKVLMLIAKTGKLSFLTQNFWLLGGNIEVSMDTY